MASFLIDRRGGGSGTRDVHFSTHRVWFFFPPKYCSIDVRIRSDISPASRFCCTKSSTSLLDDMSDSLSSSGVANFPDDVLFPELPRGAGFATSSLFDRSRGIDVDFGFVLLVFLLFGFACSGLPRCCCA